MLRKVALRKPTSLENQQKKVLLKLINKARETQFGRKYGFPDIGSAFYADDPAAFYKQFQASVPLFNYNSIYAQWWSKSVAGEANVCWPGKTKYFALSSGTSEASTKHIPITVDMTKHIKRTSIRQILTLADYDLPADFYTRGILMLGGSTHLSKKGYSYEGDLSGIQAKQIPFWFQPFYKPGRRIAATPDWTDKLDEMTITAKSWDIGAVVGVPAWIQVLFEKIIAYYKVDTIHDIWPNLAVFTHGGVAFEPYKKGFEALLAKPIHYLETYLASEGFIAYQAAQGAKGMKLVTDLGMFYEFVPFNEINFSSDGDLLPNAETLMVHQVTPGTDYAILLSTCAGTWRYLIGDTVRFLDTTTGEILITGRTKHFLSLCGEHLSVDNMNKAVQMAQETFGITVREFAVAGVNHDTLFGHEWFIGTDDSIDATKFVAQIDANLKLLNDDYRVERAHALKSVTGSILPVNTFYSYLKSKGKEGGQTKFPRVLKKSVYLEWVDFIAATK